MTLQSIISDGYRPQAIRMTVHTISSLLHVCFQLVVPFLFAEAWIDKILTQDVTWFTLLKVLVPFAGLNIVLMCVRSLSRPMPPLLYCPLLKAVMEYPVTEWEADAAAVTQVPRMLSEILDRAGRSIAHVWVMVVGIPLLLLHIWFDIRMSIVVICGGICYIYASASLLLNDDNQVYTPDMRASANQVQVTMQTLFRHHRWLERNGHLGATRAKFDTQTAQLSTHFKHNFDSLIRVVTRSTAVMSGVRAIGLGILVIGCLTFRVSALLVCMWTALNVADSLVLICKLGLDGLRQWRSLRGLHSFLTVPAPAAAAGTQQIAVAPTALTPKISDLKFCLFERLNLPAGCIAHMIDYVGETDALPFHVKFEGVGFTPCRLDDSITSPTFQRPRNVVPCSSLRISNLSFELAPGEIVFCCLPDSTTEMHRLAEMFRLTTASVSQTMGNIDIDRQPIRDREIADLQKSILFYSPNQRPPANPGQPRAHYAYYKDQETPLSTEEEEALVQLAKEYQFEFTNDLVFQLVDVMGLLLRVPKARLVVLADLHLLPQAALMIITRFLAKAKTLRTTKMLPSFLIFGYANDFVRQVCDRRVVCGKL